MFALLIVWQCIAMGMNAAYILPSPTQVLVRLWELRKPLFTATFAGHHAVPESRPCDLDRARSAARHRNGRESVGGENAVPAHRRFTRPFRQLHLRRCLCSGSATRSGARCSVTVLITFFPIAMTVFDGFRSAKTDMVDMLKTFGAGKKEIFLKLKIPAALPYFSRRSKWRSRCRSSALRSASGWAHRPVSAISAAA